MEFINRIRKIHLKQTGGHIPDSKDAESFLKTLPEDPNLLAASLIRIESTQQDAYRIGPPRASQMATLCVRFHVIGSMENLSKKEWSSLNSRLIFGMGNGLHYWIQNTDDLFEDPMRVGWWKCLACGNTSHFGYRPKNNCKKCGASKKAFEYREHWMKLPGEYPISGHPDLFLAFPGYIFRVCELKTINGNAFESLKAPLAEHEMQVQTYMWGLGLDERMPVQIDGELGFILYISKQSFRKILPLKMFPIRKSESSIKFIKNVASQYRIGIKNYPQKLPSPHSKCAQSNFGSYHAKQCVCRKKCLEFLDKGI